MTPGHFPQWSVAKTVSLSSKYEISIKQNSSQEGFRVPKRIFPAVEVPAGSASCALHPFLSLPLHSQASFPPSPRPTLRGILGPVITGIFIYLTRGAQLLKEVQKSDFVLQQLCVSVGSAYKAHVPRSGVPLSAGGGRGGWAHTSLISSPGCTSWSPERRSFFYIDNQARCSRPPCKCIILIEQVDS